jgi:hypothetical protein
VTDAIMQPNGDIVISGRFGVARFLPTGTLDITFGTGGMDPAGFVGGESRTGVALQPDGKIIWVGSRPHRRRGTDQRIARSAALCRVIEDHSAFGLGITASSAVIEAQITSSWGITITSITNRIGRRPNGRSPTGPSCPVRRASWSSPISDTHCCA